VVSCRLNGRVVTSVADCVLRAALVDQSRVPDRADRNAEIERQRPAFDRRGTGVGDCEVPAQLVIADVPVLVNVVVPWNPVFQADTIYFHHIRRESRVEKGGLGQTNWQPGKRRNFFEGSTRKDLLPSKKLPSLHDTHRLDWRGAAMSIDRPPGSRVSGRRHQCDPCRSKVKSNTGQFLTIYPQKAI
jgi:hypothetical protein